MKPWYVCSSKIAAFWRGEKAVVISSGRGAKPVDRGSAG